MNTQSEHRGRYGIYGGQYVAETLMPALKELEEFYLKAVADPSFWEEYGAIMRDYVGRPSPLFHARRLSEYCGGAQIYLKREDLNHTGAHKVNNTVGQILLARRHGQKAPDSRDGRGNARGSPRRR